MNGLSQLGQTLASMIGTIAVIDLVAILLQGSEQLSQTIDKQRKAWLRPAVIGIVGGLFGIYATLSGVQMSNGAVVSVRDVGPMMAGCLGGPLGGLIAGSIAGIQRLLYGLPDVTAGTSIPCAVSTFCIGLICGLVRPVFDKAKKRKLAAALIAASMEVFHLLLAFLYVWGRSGLDAGISLIANVTGAFIIANSVAFTLLIFVLDRVGEYQATETHEKQIESELNVATAIQKDMLPSIFPDFPGRKEFSIDASMHPAKEIGGDFYDFFFIDDRHFAFLIADVSGKGVPAALFMVISKTIIKNNLLSGLSPAEAFTRANKQLCEGNESNMFVTAWLGVLEIPTGKLTYVNAGHNPPVVRTWGGQLTFLRKISGFILAGSIKTAYRQYTAYLSDGDRIFLYTDGVTEAMNEQNEQYGEDRLMHCLTAADEQTTASQIIRDVGADIKKFTGDAEQSDDITMVALRMTGGFDILRVEAKIENFDRLSSFMSDRLDKNGVSPAVVSRMNIVLDELYSNVVRYSGSSDFIFGVSVYPGQITLKMEYGGVLFDIARRRIRTSRFPPGNARSAVWGSSLSANRWTAFFTVRKATETF